MPTVTAIIPHWNHRELLETLLASLRAQSRLFDEIIVADNGSTDDSAALAERAGARVLLLGSNFGFAAAVNRGIRAARTDWVAILNNDVTLDATWSETLIAAAEREHAWFATGKILRADSCSTIDGTFDEISRAACACRCGAGKPDAPVWDQPRRIRIAPMTAAIFRRELFDEIGFLDESFVSYLEDVDFGLRCAFAGRAGVYVPAAVSHHRGSATMGEWNKDTVRLIARNQVLLAAKHFHGWPRLPILAGQLLWGVLALRHGRGGAYLRGKISGLKAARAIRQQHGLQNAPQRLPSVVEASEREIFEIERQTGFDWYWRAYFWLLPR
jgi:GT2 family glycosyltransferase